MNRIFYCEPNSKKCYDIDTIGVKQITMIKSRPDCSRIGEETLSRDVYVIYNMNTGDVLDDFNGFGFTKRAEAELSIDRRKIAIPCTNEDPKQDNFNYQSVHAYINDENMVNCFTLTPSESKRLSVFKENHKRCTKLSPSIRFTPNEISRGVTLCCSGCGKTADITDYDMW